MSSLEFFHNLVGKLAFKVQKKLRKIKSSLQHHRFEKLGPDHSFPKATSDWLIHKELIYGGIQENVHVRQASPHDPRSESTLMLKRMRGGDRMLFHGYAQEYARYLKPFDFDKRLVLAEFGILKGNGLAIWCDLFPNARILGFDIDTSHLEDNRQNLLDRGGFSSNSPEIYTYDQFVPSRNLLDEILDGDKIDICIDDGCHLDEAIVCTMKSVMSHLNEKFVYFVEDNRKVHKEIKTLYPELSVISREKLSIINRGY